MRASLAERFWANVKKRKLGCWEWIASTSKGYGQLRFRGKMVKASHVSWFLHYGMWPKKWVLHTCDNRKCVRPKHLYEGTGKDNARDREVRGRSINPIGGQHGRAILTAAKVRVIRLSHLPDNLWAKKFSVSNRAIGMAKRGETWSHIKNPPPVRRYKK